MAAVMLSDRGQIFVRYLFFNIYGPNSLLSSDVLAIAALSVCLFFNTNMVKEGGPKTLYFMARVIMYYIYNIVDVHLTRSV